MIVKSETTFTGMDATRTWVNTVPYKNDKIEYCPYCGQKLNEGVEQFKYCPFCGKELPRTYTSSPYIIHWNYGDGTPSYPRDGIINPIVIN